METNKELTPDEERQWLDSLRPQPSSVEPITSEEVNAEQDWEVIRVTHPQRGLLYVGNGTPFNYVETDTIHSVIRISDTTKWEVGQYTAQGKISSFKVANDNCMEVYFEDIPLTHVPYILQQLKISNRLQPKQEAKVLSAEDSKSKELSKIWPEYFSDDNGKVSEEKIEIFYRKWMAGNNYEGFSIDKLILKMLSDFAAQHPSIDRGTAEKIASDAWDNSEYRRNYELEDNKDFYYGDALDQNKIPPNKEQYLSSLNLK